MNKPVYLGLSIIDLSKTLMYEFWHDYVKPKYGVNEKLCYMDTDSITVQVKIYDIYKYIAEDVNKRFELGRHIMKEFVGLRTKSSSYLKDNNDEDKKSKRQQKSVSIKENLSFKILKNVQLK